MSLKEIYNYASEVWAYAVGEAYNLDSPSEYNNEKAFVKGVEETSEHPVIFVDPDSLPVKEYEEAMLSGDVELATAIAERGVNILKDQLKAQQPGAEDAVIESVGIGQETSGEVFEFFTGGSPYAISDVMVNGKEHCLVYKPSDDWDTKEDVINNFIDSEEIAHSVAENTSVDGEALNHAIGRHEGIHCNRTEAGYQSASGVLAEETRADRGSLTGVDPDTALLIKDLRHLSANGLDPVHATGVLLVQGDDIHATGAHVMAVGMYRNVMDSAVIRKYGQDMNPRQLLLDDPDAYFSTVDESIKIYKEETAKHFHSNPQDSIAKGMVDIGEAAIDYMNNYEAAYRRQVMQEDVPDPKPARIISDDERESSAIADNDKIEELENFQPYETQQPDNPVVPSPFPSSFSGPDAAYSGDEALLKEASTAGLDIHPDLIPEPLSPEEVQRPAPSSPQQQPTLSM